MWKWFSYKTLYIVHVKSSNENDHLGNRPKTPPLFTKTARLMKKIILKRWYHVWCLVTQDLSSKVIYCIINTCLSYVRRQRTWTWTPVIVFKDKYIKLTYILGMICLAIVIFNFCRRLHKFTTCVLSICLDFFCDIVKQEDATCIACD